MEINDRIEQLIKARGLNMNSFAKQAGINYVTLYNIVSKVGRRSDPHASTLIKIKETFTDVDMNWLLTGKGEMVLPGSSVSDSQSGSRDIYEILDSVVKELQSLRSDVDEIKKDK